MSFRKNLNSVLGPITGYEISKPHFGEKLWPDVQTVLGPSGVKTVFDCGANEGQSARDFLERYPEAKIYSFEPAPTAFKKLSLFAEANPRVTAVNKALGASLGRAEFHENTFDQTNSFLAADSRGKEHFGPALACRQMTEVEITTLDAYRKQEAIDQIDLLKIDVQGFELNVLKGAVETLAAKKINAIVLELLFVPLYENQATYHDIATLLAKYDYYVAGFYDFAQTKQNHLMWCDTLFHPKR